MLCEACLRTFVLSVDVWNLKVHVMDLGLLERAQKIGFIRIFSFLE